MVVDKPSGLLSIPGRRVRDSVFQRLFFDYPDIHMVHRLDLGTSGLVVLARSPAAARELSRQFRQRTVSKAYEAIVLGVVATPEGEIDAPLAPDPGHKPRHRVDSAGKQSVTRFTRLASGTDRSHLLLRPLTGRSHQLRVHLAYIGHPIIGCDLYAPESAGRVAPRLMLHATSLEFVHPGTGAVVRFDSEARESPGGRLFADWL